MIFGSKSWSGHGQGHGVYNKSNGSNDFEHGCRRLKCCIYGL